MSKGDWQRPMDKKKFDKGFEAIFGKKEIKTWNPEEIKDEQEIDVQGEAEGTGGSGVGTEDRPPRPTDIGGEDGGPSSHQDERIDKGGGST